MLLDSAGRTWELIIGSLSLDGTFSRRQPFLAIFDGRNSRVFGIGSVDNRIGGKMWVLQNCANHSKNSVGLNLIAYVYSSRQLGL